MNDVSAPRATFPFLRLPPPFHLTRPAQEDSITLWRTLCRSPLLAKVQLVLFLNKVRRPRPSRRTPFLALRTGGPAATEDRWWCARRATRHVVWGPKQRRGDGVQMYVGARLPALSSWLSPPDFKHKFKEIQKQYSPEPRPYYVYFTSVTVRAPICFEPFLPC